MLGAALPAAADDVVPVATVSQRVAQRDPLVITVNMAVPALRVTVTDVAGRTGVWHADALTEAGTIALDLDHPAEGSAPRNGTATVTLTFADAATPVSHTTLIDRDPPGPLLTSVVRGQRVGLRWDAVQSADSVTYLLERVAGSGPWAALYEGPAAQGYTERDLPAGRYRYRLTARIPGSDGSANVSKGSAAQVRIVAQPPPAPMSPVTPVPAPVQAPPRKEGPPPRSHAVAATGRIRGPVDPAEERAARGAGAARRGADKPQAQLPQTSSAPLIAGGISPVNTATASRPQVAGPAPSSPAATAFDLPVMVLPADVLAVQASDASTGLGVSLLAGVASLALVCSVVRPRRRWVSLVLGGRR